MRCRKSNLFQSTDNELQTTDCYPVNEEEEVEEEMQEKVTYDIEIPIQTESSTLKKLDFQGNEKNSETQLTFQSFTQCYPFENRSCHSYAMASLTDCSFPPLPLKRKTSIYKDGLDMVALNNIEHDEV